MLFDHYSVQCSNSNMATFTTLRLIRGKKNTFLLKTNYLFGLDCIVASCLSQRRHMSPRKNSPFLSEVSEPSLDGSMEIAPKKRSIPDSLYRKPDIPEQLMRYNEYKDRVVIDSPGGMLSTYTPILRKSSLFSVEGWRQRWQSFKDLIVSTYSIGIIKRSVKPFKVRDFAKEAEKLFIDVNTCLTNEDKTGLLEKTTLSAYYGLMKEFSESKRKLHWRFISTLERPRVVHAMVSYLENKENLFAQVTVRLHINQVSAVQDRNGRIVSGDMNNPRELPEYVVLERHLASEHGQWKICGKLFPKH